ncbi:DUF1963 domain-containing protein [Microbacterium sp. No. 7]|uniref:DUF1963 domain-containing protein n=1 Tax=Microbacterium sp. No. 7 TaxID=1714373 RepID=UPI0006D1172C|nr:DUF1963 domain-containing protein [Microbacterium sp. No. 7]ALJ21525.1 hypothetical protein AOA12_17155 [Microbacterium sp. No. 7]
MTLWDVLASFPEGIRFVQARALVIEHDAMGAPNVPVRKWNKAIDSMLAAADAVRANPVLLERLKALPRDALPDDERPAWEDLLRPPVDELWDDPAALLADPRVGTTSLDIARAVYLVEDPLAERDGTDHGFPDARKLSHFGGLPLLGHSERAPDSPLLVQVDFGYLPYASISRTETRILREGGVPTEGMLQVFATADSDSRTAPDLPGGGVIVRYIAENDVVAARWSHSDEDGDYPWRGLKFSPGVTTEIKVWSSSVSELARWVEEEAYSAARMGCPDPTGWYGGFPDEASGIDAPRMRARPVSHLLGAVAVDFALDDYDTAVLRQELPLEDALDEHVLLIELAGVQALEDAFGDEGRLQVWMRRSDLHARRFDRIVSFLMSP